MKVFGVFDDEAAATWANQRPRSRLDARGLTSVLPLRYLGSL